MCRRHSPRPKVRGSDVSTAISPRLARWLPIAQAMAPLFGQDPLLMLAICARESGGDPNAQSPDGGLGLYQITRRYHSTFCDSLGPDGKPLVFDPAANTLYAAKLLALNAALFAGSGVDVTLPMVAAFNASVARVKDALRMLPKAPTREEVIAALDPLTTPSQRGQPGDYVSDVLRRRASFVLHPEEFHG